jgi:hypothetical protein
VRSRICYAVRFQHDTKIYDLGERHTWRFFPYPGRKDRIPALGNEVRVALGVFKAQHSPKYPEDRANPSRSRAIDGDGAMGGLETSTKSVVYWNVMKG